MEMVLYIATFLILLGISVTGYHKYKVNKVFKNSEYIEIIKSINLFFEQIEKNKNGYFAYTTKEKIKVDYKDSLSIAKSNKIFFVTKNEVLYEFLRIYPQLDELVKSWNEQYIERELEENKKYFNDIDGKSLDDQQRLAVIVDEDNNLVLAGAGSGKTLTISAKVKYLVEKKNINPDDILLISFTKKAAEEMQDRITNRLKINVEAKTFHGLGLNIITKNKAYRYDVFEGLSKVIDDYFKNVIIRDKSLISNVIMFFGYYFDIPRNIEEFENLGEVHDHFKNMDFETLKSKVNNKKNSLKKNKETLRGEVVKSFEEVMIANYLYLNGVEYQYEIAYPFPSDDPYRKQYRPDFYLPEYDIYLEHFGITSDFKTPWLPKVEEKKYIDGIMWKRDFHKKNRTILLETYSYFSKEGKLLSELQKLLKRNGVKFKSVDYEEIYKSAFYESGDKYFQEFKKLIATFIGLYKSRGYSSEDFSKLYAETSLIENKFLKKRTQMFILITKPIFEVYQKTLTENKQIDFNDMINMSTEIIKSGAITLNYKYIIVDEYQDISISRFNLIKEIKNKTNSKIIAVGDDWQSIYRFAGSDLDLFTKFETYFGYTKVLKIEKTYRNSQELIDIAGEFVMRNTKQIRKDLKSDKRHSNPVRILGYNTELESAFQKAIEEIVSLNGDESEILVLGRNNFDLRMFSKDKEEDEDDEGRWNNKYVFKNIETDILKISKKEGQVKILYKRYPNLNIYFMTTHRAKGLEAENVIIINLENKLLGFPNKISDDPVLSLVLTDLDDFDFAEERRLLYVALTRTKKSTYLLAPQINQSFFIEELVKKQGIKYDFVTEEDSIENNPICPKCQKGRLVLRESNTNSSRFLGCSNYPLCDNTFKEIELLNSKIKCTSCGGYMVRRTGEYGDFCGCTNYPVCKNVLKIEGGNETNDYELNQNYIVDKNDMNTDLRTAKEIHDFSVKQYIALQDFIHGMYACIGQKAEDEVLNSAMILLDSERTDEDIQQCKFAIKDLVEYVVSKSNMDSEELSERAKDSVIAQEVIMRRIYN